MSCLHATMLPAPTSRDPWKDLYSSDDFVRYYAGKTLLQRPEQVILDHLAGALHGADVLDLGVGGGRTTPHLARRCRRYVGVDYAAPMVEACRKRFAALSLERDVRFEVADARELPFAPASFDVVVFSFNGLDVVDRIDRLRALAECRRVLRPGGWFVHSSHNLNWTERRRAIGWSGWRATWEAWRFWSMVRRLNADRWPFHGESLMELIDDERGARTCYVRPGAHLAQLQASGFTPVEAFDLEGRRAADAAALGRLSDPWIYYLCRG